MKYILFILSILSGLSCTKEYSSLYTATLVNTTQHSIQILFYKGGVVYPNDTIKLTANQQFEFAHGWDRGNVIGGGFSSNYFGQNNDSIVVVFDELFKVAHYVNTPSQLASKYHLYSSYRNIANYLSYRLISTATSRNSHSNDYFYDFIEQDYLDAH